MKPYYIVYGEQKPINADFLLHIYVGERLSHITGCTFIDTIRLFDTKEEAEERIAGIKEYSGFKIVDVESYIDPNNVLILVLKRGINISKTAEDLRALLRTKGL